MESQNFPAPITYVSQIQVNSTEKNASGFYDQLNQMQYDNFTFSASYVQENSILRRQCSCSKTF